MEVGTCHAVCGENGAGKSTLMKVLFGLEQPDTGDILVDGAPTAIASPIAAAAAGIGMVHQHFSLVPSLTVGENVVLGREPAAGPLLDSAAMRAELRRLADRYRLAVDPDAVVGALSVAAQQKVEILKALARNVRLLILDEPTAVLTPQETDELFDRLRALLAAGLTVIFISHKLREVRALASHITVLRGGVVTGDAAMAEITDPEVARMVMGRDVTLVRRTASHAAGPMLATRDLRLRAPDAADRLDGVSLDIARGEILGLAGVDGSGQRGLVSVLTGLRTPESGTVTLDGTDARASTARLRRLGVAHLAADRYADGGAATLSLADNAIAGWHRERRFGLWPFLSRARAERETAAMVAAYDVRARSPRQALGSLSGGNAQKLIAAREFRGAPRLLIADQPTRGIDIQAAAFIRAKILALAAAGTAVLLVTADLDELLALADRVAVLFGGRIAETLDNRGLTPERLGPAMLGMAA